MMDIKRNGSKRIGMIGTVAGKKILFHISNKYKSRVGKSAAIRHNTNIQKDVFERSS